MVKVSRQLIVNADDFGETAAITRGILDCFLAGTVRSTSVIVNGAFWPEAAAIIRETPGLDYGLHLNLTAGKPCLPAEDLRPFVEPDGSFPTRASMIARLLRHRGAVAAIEAELTEQARRLSETGVPLTHVNFHDHLFFLPALWKICLAIKDRFSIPFVRRPYQIRSVRHPLSGQSLKRGFLNLCFHDRQVPGAFEVNFVDSLGTEHLEEVYVELLRNCGTVSELVVHPGVADPDRNKGFDARRVFEHDFLSSDKLHSLVQREDIQLIGYRDLPGEPGKRSGSRESR